MHSHEIGDPPQPNVSLARRIRNLFFRPRRLLPDDAPTPDRIVLILRMLVAVAPVLAIQLLIALLFAKTGQLSDLFESVQSDQDMRFFFAIGFLVNSLLVAVVIVWRIHKVENPLLRREETARFFLWCKWAFVLLCLALPFLTYWAFGETTLRELISIHFNVVVSNKGGIIFLPVLAFYVLMVIPSLHSYRRHSGDWNTKAGGVGKLEKSATIVSHGHRLVLILVVLLALLYVFYPDPVIARLGGPLALYTFVWTVFMVVFWFADLRSLGRIVGLVILGVMATSAAFGIRDVRRDVGVAHQAAELAVPETGPVFVIASDGGGIRSAYWTTAVLGAIAADAHLRESHPEMPFTDRIVAMGGASGGSVGVGLFAALMAADVGDGDLRAKAAAVLSEDYISIAATYLFWRDFLASAVCYRFGIDSLLGERCGKDRVIAMERRMERAFETATDGASTLSGPLVNKPLVYFNTTQVGSGRAHVIGSQPVAFDQNVAVPPVYVEPTDIPMSTAMLMSARFPLVSPDGRVGVTDTASGVAVSGADDAREITLIDGGYADNSGSLALTALLKGGALDPQRVFAISITNNVEREGDAEAAFRPILDCVRPENEASSGDTLRLLLSPLSTLDGVRARASEQQRNQLRALLPRGHYIEVPLLGCVGDVPAPLGWTLSEASRRNMDDKADLYMGPASPLRKFVGDALACATC